jgi:integrase
VLHSNDCDSSAPVPDDHTKTGRGHIVPLSAWSIRELQSLKAKAADSPYILPGSDGTGPLDPKYITRSVARCLNRFKRHGIAKFTAHDLRRTGRTGLARLGVKVDIAERVLNHARERIEATYDLHDYLDEKRQALEKWAGYLERSAGQAWLPASVCANADQVALLATTRSAL